MEVAMALQMAEKSRSRKADSMFVMVFSVVVVAVMASMTLQVAVSKARGNEVAAVGHQMKTP